MLSKILSLLFPPDNEEKILSSLTHLKAHPYTVVTTKNNRVLTCVRYDEPAVHATIILLKKRGNKHATNLLSQLLSDVLLEELSTSHIWKSKDTVIVPMPTTRKRKRERGFSPIEKICNALPEELRSRIVTNALAQTKNIPMQKTLTRDERFKNVMGIFSVTNSDTIRNKHIILLDDVITTGATLDEATRALTRAGAEVTAVALARA